jgi:hypothetical protein
LDNRVTVLAYVEGDKQYIDKNGNNLYDSGEQFAQIINGQEVNTNIGSFFRDDNEDNAYNANLGEYIYSRAVTGSNLTCGISTLLQPNISATCDDKLDTVVRQQLLFGFAENTPTFTNVSASGSLLAFKLFGNSALSVPMPTGTTVSVSVEDNTKNNDLSCASEFATGSTPVANVFDLMTPTTFKNSSQTYYGYRLKECAAGDFLKVSVSSPDGKVSTIYVPYQ